MAAEFGCKLLSSWRVEFIAVDLAVSFLTLRGGCCCAVLSGLNGGDGWFFVGITVEHSSRSRMSKGATPSSSFDDTIPRPRSQPLQYVAIIRRIHDLRPMRQRQGPSLRCRRDQMDEATSRRHSRLVLPSLELLTILLNTSWSIPTIPFTLFCLASSRSGVDF